MPMRLSTVALLLLLTSCGTLMGLLTNPYPVPVDDSLAEQVSAEELEALTRSMLRPASEHPDSVDWCRFDLEKRTVRLRDGAARELTWFRLRDVSLHVRASRGLAVGFLTRRGKGASSLPFCTIPEAESAEAPQTTRNLGRLASALLAYGVEVRPEYRRPGSAAELHFARQQEIPYPDGRRFEGRTIAGKPSGPGVLHYPDGERYEGPFENGVPEGQGVLHLADGRELRGIFEAGQPPTSGVVRAPDGTGWEGPIQDGKLHGEGRMTLADGTVYEGPFRRGQRHGRFLVKLASGRDRTQQWEQGQLRFDGPGPKSLARLRAEPSCGLKTKHWLFLDGGCEGGLAQGQGRVVAADSSHPKRIRGHFEAGDLVSGRMTDPMGNVYQGHWQGFTLQGFGSHQKDGELVFEGGFLAGQPLGEGVCGVDGALEPCEIRDGERVDAFHVARLAARKEQARQQRCASAWKDYEKWEGRLRGMAEKEFCEDKRDRLAEQMEVGIRRRSKPDAHYFSPHERPSAIRLLFRCVDETEERVESRLKELRSSIGRLGASQCAAEEQLAAAEQGRRSLGSYLEKKLDANRKVAKRARSQIEEMDRILARRKAQAREADRQAVARHFQREFQNIGSDWSEIDRMHQESMSRIWGMIEPSPPPRPEPMARPDPGRALSGGSLTAGPAPGDPFAALREQCAARNGSWDARAKRCRIPMHPTRVVIQHPGSACYDPSGRTCTTGETLGGNPPAHSGAIAREASTAKADPPPAEPKVLESRIVQGSHVDHDRDRARREAQRGAELEALDLCGWQSWNTRLEWLDNGCDATSSAATHVKCWFRVRAECLDQRCDRELCGTGHTSVSGKAGQR